MEFTLYEMEQCPFCKHFRRLFFKTVPEGKNVILKDHHDPGWIDHDLEFVPTVIATENNREISRIVAKGMVGIKKEKWEEWLDDLEVI
ncbi:MAG: hypothetical protein ACMUIG_05170 [Thermoplasmatota archaeon]